MPKLYTVAVTALGVSLLVSCERAARPAPKPSQVTPQPVSMSAELPVAADPVDALPNDSLIVTDTAGADFTNDDLSAVKSVVDARLHLDQFTASGPATPYGKPCRFYDTTSVRRYTGEDVRFAYVRPRLIKISFARDDNYVRLVNVAAEITRVAVLRRGVDGKWYGVVKAARDTLSFLVSSSVADSTWTVCEKPAHTNGWNDGGSEKPFSPWLPVRASDTERMTVVWDESFSTPKLRQLADSVSELPSKYVVEGNPEPEMPIYYHDVCPGEGCEYGQWLACDTVRVHQSPAESSPTAFMVHRGDTITTIKGDVKVTQAGKVIFHRPMHVDMEGTNMWFTPADTLYPLLHFGEGFGSWYFRGKESGGFFFFGAANVLFPDPHRGEYEVVRPIESEWWVRVRSKRGQEGWFVPNGYMRGMEPHYEDGPMVCGPKSEGDRRAGVSGAG